MVRIGIVEKNGGTLINSVRRVLAGKNCAVERAKPCGEYDIVLWKDGKVRRLTSRSLIVCPGGERSAAENCLADCAVSCGMRENDTLTVSSTLSDGGFASLRREIITPDGQVVPPCEIPLKGIPCVGEDQLAVASLLLLLGAL